MEIPEFDDHLDLIRTINPLMPPKQAVAQIDKFNRLEHNKSQTPVEKARSQLLRNHDYNPEDWTFYSNAYVLEGDSFDDTMIRLARNFPEGVEFLVIQGEFLGGVLGRPGINRCWSAGRYKYMPGNYSAFVRLRPKQLEEK